MNILFTLCGRAGSKGFKNKNLKNFLGKPLVYYSLAAIKLYKEKHAEHNVDIALNTDSAELANIVAQQKKLEVFYIHREAALGGDAVSKVSVILDCLTRAEEHNGVNYDVVVDLDITSPLRTLHDIENAINKKVEREDVDVVYSVTDSRRNPYFNMVKQEEGYFCKAIQSNYTARQQAPSFYDMNASIYAYSPNALRIKNHAIFFNDRCDAIIMKDTGILDIDAEEDYDLMQVIGKYLFETNCLYREVAIKANNIL